MGVQIYPWGYKLALTDAQARNARSQAKPRNGPRILDTAISGILVPFQAARRGADWVKYTPSGVRRSRALWRRLAL